MKDDKKKKSSLVFIIFQILILLSILGLVIKFYLDSLLNDTEMIVIIVMLALMSLSPIFALKKRYSEGKELMNHQSNAEIVQGTVAGETTLKSDAKKEEDGVTPGRKPNSLTNKLNTIVPILVLALTAAYVFLGPNFLTGSQPEGRWYYYMETGSVGGVENLTEYWYMDLNADGSLDIGWKNIGYAEESQGWGNWYESGGIVYLTIHYDYGDTVTKDFYISSGKFYDANLDTYSGWEKE